ncbi:hypothetical protein [Alphaproteobacteria bacterium endosymbiont of Tiliacea citrago]|uniref:hypothetical protein n=1 Tax=Alphaproteobacteria bacterium endosymbiont of Tiliacea citrago TaxID=3077944 RepID=UPI00313D4A6F
MLLFLIFSIFTFFLILVQRKTQNINFSIDFEKDQLKSIAGFLRSHENYEKIDQEEDLGISESFFSSKIKLIKNEECLPFDAPYFLYPNLFKNNSQMKKTTFLNSSNQVFLNERLVSKYEIQYYSGFLRNVPSDIVVFRLIILPNTEALILNSII